MGPDFIAVEFAAVLKLFSLDFESGLCSTMKFIKLPPVS